MGNRGNMNITTTADTPNRKVARYLMWGLWMIALCGVMLMSISYARANDYLQDNYYAPKAFPGPIDPSDPPDDTNSKLKWRFQTDEWVHSSPAIGADGTVYIGSLDNHLYAIHGDTTLSTSAPWPRFHHNNRNTGRVSGGK